MIRKLLCLLGWHGKPKLIDVKQGRCGKIYSIWACAHCRKKSAFLEFSDGRAEANYLWVTYVLRKNDK